MRSARLARTASRLLATAAVALMGAACSSAEATPTTSPSTGTASTTACGLPAQLELVAGGRATFPRANGAELRGADGPESPLTVLVEDTRFVVRERTPGADVGTPTVAIACGGTLTHVPVTVKPLQWTKLAAWKGTAPPAATAPAATDTGPLGREYFSMWMDEGDPRALYVFGGFVYEPKQFTPASDMWRFDLTAATWAAVSMAGPVPTAPGARVAPGAAPRSLFFFGGASLTDRGALKTTPRLARLDYGATPPSWSEAPSAAAGPASYTGAFVYDAKRSRWLSVCGMDTERGAHCNVDAYTVSKGWTRVATKGRAPAGRSGFHYALDEETDRLVIFGGELADETIAGDTWTLELGGAEDDRDGPRWVQLSAKDDAAPARRNGAWVLDPVGHRLLVWGGTADGRRAIRGIQSLSLDRGEERWATFPTPDEVKPRASGMAVFDAKGRRALLGFGNEATNYTDLWALAL